MRRRAFRLFVASSWLLAAVAAAETRPQYGGALRVLTRIAPTSLDPADNAQPDSITRRNLTRLIFENLVTLDIAGRPQPALATSWEPESNDQRWRFRLRHNVKFHDGSPLTAETVAASLRTANPSWTIYANGDSLQIEDKLPAPDLPAELALSRNAIAKRSAGRAVVGTGPFHIADWQPGRKLTLAAEEEYWNGRPFLDSVAIEFGKSPWDQMIALELGKADLVEVLPEQVRRAVLGNRRVVSAAAMELVAIVFARDRQSPEEGRLREALSLSIDRSAMRNVVLQGQGEPAGGLLPNWMTGYAFVFPTKFNLLRAQELRAEVPQAPVWSLGYDQGDPLARLIAERIALNAHDAGLRLQAVASDTGDARLVRILLPSVDSGLALVGMAARLGLPETRSPAGSIEGLFAAESAILKSQRVIPLFELPGAYAVSSSVKSLELDRDGGWHLPDVWLGSEKP